ncbi:MAG: glutamine-hydrolyzing GMP synthase [bacterium]|jgi:GMP synthase (glutamine-hydrolysing)
MGKDLKTETVVVIDFGAQYSQLIARRIRECHVHSEVMSHNTPLTEIIARKPRGIIFSGGSASIDEPDAPKVDSKVFEAGIPILAIGYGMQLMAHLLGGRVRRPGRREYGQTTVSVNANADLFKDIGPDTVCWMNRGDGVEMLPEGFQTAAQAENVPIAAFVNPEKRLYGIQFHPEAVHTEQGMEMLRNFLFNICGCRGEWSMESFIEAQVAAIRDKVGAGKVLCALSGGIDSSVAATLVHRAVGDQLTCVFVNHGLLRKGEPEGVIRTFREQFKVKLVYVDAAERFLAKLQGITDPEAKRKIIGGEFIRVFEEEAAKLGKIDFLVQGTIYPDIVESGTATAATIKSHHNVGGLPDDMEFELIEPLRDLFKDEVRVVAGELGLPEEIVWRQPFPGPGLGIRVIGAITKEKLDILREADAIITEEVRRAGLYRDIWQVFAVLPTLRSVGVMDDARTYAYPIILRAVTSTDGMTAEWVRFSPDVLERIASRVVGEVEGVNRLLYDLTSKPPGTIEWE